MRIRYNALPPTQRSRSSWENTIHHVGDVVPEDSPRRGVIARWSLIQFPPIATAGGTRGRIVRARPAYSRSRGAAYRKSSPITRIGNTTGPCNQDWNSGTVRLLTRIFSRNSSAAARGFERWKNFPTRPFWACPESRDGSKNTRYSVRLTNRLVLLELDQKLTSTHNPVNPSTSRLPMITPHNSARPTIGSPWASTARHGTVTASAAGQGEEQARHLPTTMERRLIGVSSSVSSTARSRAPLRLSAPRITPMNTPT